MHITSFMGSWQAKCFELAVRLLVRRRRWGKNAPAVARRARRLFGAGFFYQWLKARGLEVTGVVDTPVPAEWVQTLTPDRRVIMYLHGGGFVSCSPATHRPLTAALARLTSRRVFAPDYRLAPEYPFPAGLDDIVASYRWLLANGIAPGDIAVAGDSAGGGLVLSLFLCLRDAGVALPACGVCFSPWTDLSGTFPSIYENNGRCAMFRPDNIAEFARAYVGDGPVSDVYASPAHAELSGLPPVLFQVGSTELLLDDSRKVHEKILESGGASRLEIFDDLFHGWQMLDGLVPEARVALEHAAKFIDEFQEVAANGPAV